MHYIEVPATNVCEGCINLGKRLGLCSKCGPNTIFVEDTPALMMARLIAEGVEYPDAQWLVTKKFGISAEEVQRIYDGEDNV